MNANKFTTKSAEAVESAKSIADRNSNQAVDEQHLLLALLRQTDGLVPELMQSMGTRPESFGVRRRERGFKAAQGADLFACRRYVCHKRAEQSVCRSRKAGG